MKKLAFILLVTAQFAVYAQKGLSEEGYKHWIKAVALMEKIKEESDYFLVVDEFGKVAETDPTYADIYYNKGVLYTKMGELGGGLPMFDSAKTYYDKYIALQPADKLLKELALLEQGKESFMKNILESISLIEAGIPSKIPCKGCITKWWKNGVYVDSFYIKQNCFSIADYKKVITPMAIAIASKLKGKIFNIPYQQSRTGDDNSPYPLSPNTAEQIIEILNCITDKHFFILTWNHYQMMIYSKSILYLKNNGKEELNLYNTDAYLFRIDNTLYSQVPYILLEQPRSIWEGFKCLFVELVLDKNNEYTVLDGSNTGLRGYNIKKHKISEYDNYEYYTFRLAFSASEINK